MGVGGVGFNRENGDVEWGVMSPHEYRRVLLQVLFAFDAQKDGAGVGPDLARGVAEGAWAESKRGESREAVLSRVVRQSLEAWGQREHSDAWAMRLAPQWPTHRQPAVDRAILRLGVWEMTHESTPAAVVIDECVDLAKEFSTTESPSFVNGVLDAIRKEIELMKSGLPAT